jgi:hypothetical protein
MGRDATNDAPSSGFGDLGIAAAFRGLFNLPYRRWPQGRRALVRAPVDTSLGAFLCNRCIGVTMTSIRWRRLAVVLLLASLVAACGTTPAPNFRGRWQPVNHFDDSPKELPLAQAYVYTASPLDRTLKTMLTRWARDSRMTLSYLHGSDYTLYGPVAQIGTPSLQQAVSQLNAAYAAEGISISADERQITVRGAAVHVPTDTAAP